MSENPYAPPTSGLGGGSLADRPSGTGSFEIGTCVSEAWATTWANFPLWAWGLLLSFVCIGLATLTVIGFFLAVPVLGWGAVLFFLNLHDRRASIGDLFSGFSRYAEALVGMLVAGLLLMLVSFLGQAVSFVGQLSDSAALLGIGALVNLLWAFLVMPRLYFSYLYIVDQGMSPVEAVQASWERTSPVKWRVALLVLVSGLVASAVAIPAILVLAFGLADPGPAGVVVIALLFTLLLMVPIVLLYLMWISAYRQMEGSGTRA